MTTLEMMQNFTPQRPSPLDPTKETGFGMFKRKGMDWGFINTPEQQQKYTAQNQRMLDAFTGRNNPAPNIGNFSLPKTQPTMFAGYGSIPQETDVNVGVPQVPSTSMFAGYGNIPMEIDTGVGVPQVPSVGVNAVEDVFTPRQDITSTPVTAGAQPTNTSWGAVGGQSMPAQFQSRDQLVQWQQANGLTPDGLYGQNSAAKFAELNTPTNTASTPAISTLDAYSQAGDAMSYAGINNLSGTGMEVAPTTSTSMWDSVKDFTGMTGKDMLGAGGSLLESGLGAYSMFKGISQKDTALDQRQAQINLAQDEYDENLRHRKAITSQNKRA